MGFKSAFKGLKKEACQKATSFSAVSQGYIQCNYLFMNVNLYLKQINVKTHGA